MTNCFKLFSLFTTLQTTFAPASLYRLRLVLRDWKLQTDEAKRNKAKLLLEESRERVSELEETRKNLDKERKETESKMIDLRADLENARKELSELDAATTR
jgi:septal ring factor EnvC (AmiA/AmiB activator)